MILDIIAFSGISIFAILLLIANIKLRIKNKKIIEKLAQEVIDKGIIVQKLNDELKKYQNAEIEKTDGFLKFISESRDWAFQYIEDVQKELLDFQKAVEPELDYAQTYGKSVGEGVYTRIIDNISSAYFKLKKIMPEEDTKSKS